MRAVVCNGAQWYNVCWELGLRRAVEHHLLNLIERLSKGVKRRLKGFLRIPCRCGKPLNHVRRPLEAWRGFYNWVRYHITLEASPCGYQRPEPLGILGLMRGRCLKFTAPST
ncbi:MAG: hypothetical protein QW587_06415 [Candidatus Bathyarchaeia archaeon]